MVNDGLGPAPNIARAQGPCRSRRGMTTGGGACPRWTSLADLVGIGRLHRGGGTRPSFRDATIRRERSLLVEVGDPDGDPPVATAAAARAAAEDHGEERREHQRHGEREDRRAAVVEEQLQVLADEGERGVGAWPGAAEAPPRQGRLRKTDSMVGPLADEMRDPSGPDRAMHASFSTAGATSRSDTSTAMSALDPRRRPVRARRGGSSPCGPSENCPARSRSGSRPGVTVEHAHRVGGNHATAVDDDQAVAEPLGLFQVSPWCRRSPSSPRGAASRLSKIALRPRRVDADGRLVEQQDVRACRSDALARFSRRFIPPENVFT